MAEGLKSGFYIQRLPKIFHYIDYPPKDNFEFFTALEPFYHIVERIFSFLDYQELRKCCLVNKSWKELAERTLGKRSYATWFTYYRTQVAPRKVHFKMSDKFWHNNVACVIILFDNRRISSEKISNLRVWTYLKRLLIPAGIEYYAIKCPSVVSHFSSEVKDAKDCGSPSMMDGLFIPKIPNIKTVMLQYNEKTMKAIKNIEPDYEVKCLLMFTIKGLKRYLSDLLYQLVPEEKASSVAIGGGIVRGTNTIKQYNNYSHCLSSSNNIFCIAFLKNKNVDANFDAYSIVLQGNHLTEAELEGKLLQFKSQITLRKQAFGVRICCVAKKNQKEESRVFSKIFSGIPVLGFTALGEIGWNCFGSSENDDGETKRKRRKHSYMDLVDHEMSTVFVLITWGLKRYI